MPMTNKTQQVLYDTDDVLALGLHASGVHVSEALSSRCIKMNLEDWFVLFI